MCAERVRLWSLVDQKTGFNLYYSATNLDYVYGRLGNVITSTNFRHKTLL